MQETFSQEQVATVLEVSVDTLRQYRSKRFANSPLRLVPTGPMVGKAKHYTREDLVELVYPKPRKAGGGDVQQGGTRHRCRPTIDWWVSHGAAADSIPSNHHPQGNP